jgi:hypothetical protein
MQDSVLISLRLQKNTEHAARMEAARRHISRSEFVRRAVVDYLTRLRAESKEWGTDWANSKEAGNEH